MPRKPFPCAVCGEPFQPSGTTLPRGVARHKRCRDGDVPPPAPKTPAPPPASPPLPPVALVPPVEDGPEPTRLEDLKWLRDELRASIRSADPEKRAPLVREFRGVLAELAELAPVEVKEDAGVVDIRSLITDRLAGAAGARDAAGGTVDR